MRRDIVEFSDRFVIIGEFNVVHCEMVILYHEGDFGSFDVHGIQGDFPGH